MMPMRVALNNGARPELRCWPGADTQPVRSVSERAQVHWGMELQQQMLCRVFRASAGIFLLYTRSNTGRFFYRCPENRK